MSAENLSAGDLAMFRTLGVTDELLQAGGVRRVADAEARELIGRSHRGSLSGIVFPRYDPTTGRVVAYRVRRDHPEIENGKPHRKYLASPDRAHLYFPPGASSVLGDTHVPVVLVEAEKSALAITAAAQQLGIRLLAIGLGGCWGWRGRIGKTVDPVGARVDELGPCSDLGLIGWTDRQAVILLDSNVATNNRVHAAQTALATELTSRGARVAIASLPSGSGVNGPDDYIAKCGAEAIAAVLKAARPIQDRRSSPKGRMTSTHIIELLMSEGAEFWHTPYDREAYVSLRVNGHLEHHPAKSAAFGDLLAHRCFVSTGECAPERALSEAVRNIVGMAVYAGEPHPVFLRVGEFAGRIYYDLGSSSHEVIEIDSDGWRVVHDSPVRFLRKRGMGALPMPCEGGDVQEIADVLGFAGESAILVVAWLIGAMFPSGPYPLVSLIGEAGSGKSTRARMLRRLVDPVEGDLRVEPRNIDDLFVAASSSHIVAYDNLSVLPACLSDAFCMLSTGGSLGKRRLFSDADEVRLDAVRPVVLTSINDVVTRDDLRDRSITLRMDSIDPAGRRTERDIWVRFNNRHPFMLGALLSGLSASLRNASRVSLPCLPRMGDWAMRCAAAGVELGWPEGALLRALDAAQRGAAEDWLADDPLAELLSTVSLPWETTCGELLSRLRSVTPPRGGYVPASPRALTASLDRLAPDLRRVGIRIERRRGTGGSRLVLFSRIEDRPDRHYRHDTDAETANSSETR